MPNPIYAIGDIHGQIDLLEEALFKIERDGGPDAQVVFLGDLVDRGPDSAAVIDLLMTGQKEGRNWTVLRGNHDRMFSYFLEDLPRPDPQVLLGMDWFSDRIGGRTTLASYGIETDDTSRYYQIHPVARDAVPQSHIDFMESLPAYHQQGELLFVHAGIRPGVPLAEQTEDDMCWIRREFLLHNEPYPWLVVHGHTHRPRPEHRYHRVNLDSGAGHGNSLTAAVFEGRDVWVLGDKDREQLLPGDY